MNTRVDPGDPLQRYAVCRCGRNILAHQTECGVCEAKKPEPPCVRLGLSAGLRRALYALVPISALWWFVFASHPMLGIGIFCGTWLGLGAGLFVWGRSE